MLFRHIITVAFFSALISGLLLGAMQSLSTSPLIYSAEVYEVTEKPSVAPHTDAATHSHEHQHQHDENGWSPKDGIERVAYTYLADILIAFGHSLLLTSFMALIFLKFAKPAISWRSGLIIGLGGYLSFYLATIIGLPPEVPGTLAADLHARQTWWTLTVIATAIGLSTLYFAPKYFKAIGILLLLAPHLIGAPHLATHGFLNNEANAVSALSQLEHQFLLSTAWVNLIYWLVLGAVSGFLAKKLLRMESRIPAYSLSR